MEMGQMRVLVVEDDALLGDVGDEGNGEKCRRRCWCAPADHRSPGAKGLLSMKLEATKRSLKAPRTSPSAGAVSRPHKPMRIKLRKGPGATAGRSDHPPKSSRSSVWSVYHRGISRKRQSNCGFHGKSGLADSTPSSNRWRADPEPSPAFPVPDSPGGALYQ